VHNPLHRCATLHHVDLEHVLLEWMCVSCLEEARLHCTSVGLVAPLVDIMSSGNNGEVVQACRALGNMCFDNGLFAI